MVVKKGLILFSVLWAFSSAHAKTEVIIEKKNVSSNLLFTQQIEQVDYHYRDIDIDDQGIHTNTSGDSYITLTGFDLPRSRACFFVLDARLDAPMDRPAVFELFWAAHGGGFSEAEKARFLISDKNFQERHLFVVPLCKLHNFSGNLYVPNRQRNIKGLRFDYPSNRTIGLQIHRMGLVAETELRSLVDVYDAVVLESYERLTGDSFKSLDVALPKLYFGIEHGFRRLVRDPFFMTFWLLAILLVFVALVKGKRNN